MTAHRCGKVASLVAQDDRQEDLGEDIDLIKANPPTMWSADATNLTLFKTTCPIPVDKVRKFRIIRIEAVDGASITLSDAITIRWVIHNCSDSCTIGKRGRYCLYRNTSLGRNTVVLFNIPSLRHHRDYDQRTHQQCHEHQTTAEDLVSHSDLLLSLPSGHTDPHGDACRIPQPQPLAQS
jgi:hypothetical protein